MAVFEVGKTYCWAHSGFDPITVIKRTPKYIYAIVPFQRTFRMLIRHDENGNEYTLDSTAPKRLQWDAHRVSAEWELLEEENGGSGTV